MPYVDGFLVAVPKAKSGGLVPEFSRKAGEMWKEHGASRTSNASRTTCPMAS